ncbi:MAG: DUF255 domain-containing protein [Thermoplasmata archaeon]
MGKHTDIRWREWGEEAFKEAKEAEKPVLLDLSAVWCHWCHVMDETSYSDDEVIQLINESLVPIRVDIDQRPDIRERYNFGGYPTTAFLDGDGEVITGGTYIPPDQMKRTLIQVKEYYESSGGKARRRRVLKESEVEPSRGAPKLDIMEEIVGHLLEQYDELHGGFGNAPKFPQPEGIDLVLYKYKLSGNRYFRKLVEKTLAAMAGHGMYDDVEGGFFRYSVNRDWSEPHYEKMLEVNVGLLRNYLNAFVLLKEPWYRDVALDVLRYLEGNLHNPKGGFFASQDADEEYYGMSQKGRDSVQAPYIDKTLYADLNGQAVSSYFRAGAVLGEERFLKAGLTTLALIEKRLLKEDGFLYHYRDGESGVDGLLGDYVYLSKAFLEAYEHVGEMVYLDKCKAVIDRMLTSMRDERGLLTDRQTRESDIGLLKAPQRPLVENAHAALVLLKLEELAEEQGYGDAARQILEGFSGQYSRYSIFAAPYAIAVYTYLKGPLRLVLVGRKDDGRTRQMNADLVAAFEPRRVVQILQPGTATFQDAKYPDEPAPAVYACVGRQCSSPITDLEPMKAVEVFVGSVETQEGIGAA